ncbi:MAG: histidinol phosphate phosphatase domain-containing protein [Thermodesulfobacteriota bacterium]|nr:histidinol phosphate phosphatase domain-containing protein [Thermodesulfobacteriota bacterium]
MIDLHTHTLLSDGDLIPSELARRAEVMGYRYLGLTDHVDSSNLDLIVPRLAEVAARINPHIKVKVIPGAELTHVPPPLFGAVTEKARELGAAYVVAHGETLAEPVAPGTNRAAIEAGVDILAHPGLLTLEEAAHAAEKNILLEISARKGHSLANGHVALMAKRAGAGLVLNTDAHGPGDLIDLEFARKVAFGAGLDEEDFRRMQARAMDLIERVGWE